MLYIIVIIIVTASRLTRPFVSNPLIHCIHPLICPSISVLKYLFYNLVFFSLIHSSIRRYKNCTSHLTLVVTRYMRAIGFCESTDRILTEITEILTRWTLTEIYSGVSVSVPPYKTYIAFIEINSNRADSLCQT